MTPRVNTSAPDEINPAINALSNNSPEIRVSRPINTLGRVFLDFK